MIEKILDVNTVFFSVWGYPMSYVEFFGTIFTGWSVYLTAKNKILSWPIGILGVILYMFLFFQISLYSDFVEQIYYLLTGFWGWWVWTHPKTEKQTDGNSELRVGFSGSKENVFWGLVVIGGAVFLGYLMSKVHLIWPIIFVEPAAYPYWDSLTTVMSFVANYYLVKRRVENWYLWIVVDVIGVILYFQKGVIFLSLLYLAFLINAFRGWREWVRIYKNYEKEI